VFALYCSVCAREARVLRETYHVHVAMGLLGVDIKLFVMVVGTDKLTFFLFTIMMQNALHPLRALHSNSIPKQICRRVVLHLTSGIKDAHGAFAQVRNSRTAKRS
jgi:hypothetical protein